MDRFLIYGLVDPNTLQLRYIGKSCSGLARPRRHFQPSTYNLNNGHKASWVRGLLTQGNQPSVVVIQAFDTPDILCEAERCWIRYFRSMGCPLTNLTDGGEGTPGCYPSEETRALLSSSHKGKKFSVETRRKMSEAHKGLLRTPQHCRRLSEARLGHSVSGLTRAKLAAAGTLRFASAESRLAMSRAKGGRPIVDQNGTKYETAREASWVLGVPAGDICAVLKGRQRSARGYVFRYA
jgi:hypothetical protein